MIVALDLGTSLGFAVSDDDDSVRSGVWRLGKVAELRRVRRLWDHLEELNRDQTVELVAYELPAGNFRFAGGPRAIFQFLGVVRLWATARGIPVREIHQGTLKKRATGKGNASKDAMMSAAREAFPCQTVTNHNQADALNVLAWAIEEIQPCVVS